MDAKAFEDQLRKDGFTEVTTKTLASDYSAGEHAHEFDARILVLDGAFKITVDGKQTTYGPGDTFAMDAGCMHAEDVGPDGTTVVSGRRY